jgi:nondiscriminating glutamyl-tRNA synthetase
MSNVRVRFAPSPTGHLHVGSLRTALYSYLFAKKEGGVFVLRIEDTDQKRFVPGSVESLIETLHSMGVQYTEGPFEKVKIAASNTISRESSVYPGITEVGEYGPYIQSERLALYKKYADMLVEQKKAYRCFCTAERLDAMRAELAQKKQAPKYDRHCLNLSPPEVQQHLDENMPYVIRFLIPENRTIAFRDLVRGDVTFHTKDIDDPVIMKSDGYPTYHLAVVVDDHLMQISHALRSEEWLPSTPKHILLYEALGWDVPHIGHLSVILGRDGKKKLSKRDGGVSVDHFLSQGYLKEALINFIVLLGWNPGKGNTQEIFSLEELEQKFDLSGLHKAGAVFDLKKLDWMNAEYIKKLSIDELYGRVATFGWFNNEFFQSVAAEKKTEAYLKKVLAVEHDRLVRLTDVAIHNPFLFIDISYDSTLLSWKGNDAATTREALLKMKDVLRDLDDAIWEDVHMIEEKLLEAAGDRRGDYLWPLRVALTGAERSPSPAQVAWVLGRESALKRLEQAIEKLSE